MKNLGFAYYKDYFKSLKFKRIRNEWYPVFSGKTFLDRLQNLRWNMPAQPPFGGNHGFSLTTIYPGLLVGSGYIHEIGADKKDENGKPLVSDELKLGFYFDHTTGLPVIPGSSVKGVLRSAFDKDDGGYVKYLLEDKPKIKTGLNIKKLKEHIFEGKGYIEKNGKKVWDHLPMHQRDVFLDAFPVKVKNKFLGNDYITPHEHPLKNPNPIQFLKVMPGVTFRFEFILRDYVDENGNKLAARDKMKLFKAILEDLGIGAKTNVGYGQFERTQVESEHSESSGQSSSQPQQSKPVYTPPPPPPPSEEDKIIKMGAKLQAEVIGEDKKYYYFRFDFGKKLKFKKKKTKLNAELKVGQKVKIEITSDYAKSKSVNFSNSIEIIH